MTLLASLELGLARLRRERQGAALLGWALAGALTAGLVAWSVSLAEKESRGHSVAQDGWRP